MSIAESSFGSDVESGHGGDEQIFPPPTLVLTPPQIPSGLFVSETGDIDAMHLSHVSWGAPEQVSANLFTSSGPGFNQFRIDGHDLAYDTAHRLTGGTFMGFRFTDTISGGVGDIANVQFTLASPGVSATVLQGWIDTDATQAAFNTILSGDNDVQGGVRADLMRGYGGGDLLEGLGGGDTIYGGQGDDEIFANSGTGLATGPKDLPTYLRGEEGDDIIIGGDGFDDINGNQGNDSATGGNGDDWVVGGKDDDLLLGDAGNDIVWGNLGDDSLNGGVGADQVRGGQGDDVVFGGDGDDYVSGDRGDDTVTGGAGADLFHGSQDAGVDRIEDFHATEGDRVMLDPGTSYTVTQVGGDTVVEMGGGNKMILVGVQLASMPSGWIFEG